MKNKTLKSLLIYGLGITTTLGTMIPTISSCGSKKSNDVISGYCVLEVMPYFALIGIASGLIVGTLVYLIIHKVPISYFDKIINDKYKVKEQVW